MSVQPNPSTPIGINDLPYLDEYLREVLRPRVEAALKNIEASLAESIWTHLVRTVAGERPGATEANHALVRSLISERLGLKIQAGIQTSFEPGRAAPAAAPAAPPTAVRRPLSAAPSPLVGAMLSNQRTAAR